MKYCPNCGLRNEDYNAICEGCGAIMVQKKQKQKSPLPIILAILAILILAAGIGGYVYFRNHSAAEPDTIVVTVPVETLPAPTEKPEETLPRETLPSETLPEETEATDTTEPSKEPLIYDDRVAAYSADNPEWETLHFEWECQNGGRHIALDIPVDRQMYLYYKGLQRYYNMENLHLYVNDENNREIIRSIVAALKDVAKQLSYDDAAVAREIVKFVQDVIEYQYDSDTTGQEEFPRYPIETLYEGWGDCEDTSILMAALLDEWGYEVGLLHLPGHAAVAIRTSDTYNATAYYEIDGHRYLFIESTGSGWSIGEIPDEFLDAGVEMYMIP